MVAKINRGASLYGAVIYNQRKVDEATARIIAGNRMITDLTGNPHNVMQQTLWAFESYLAANRNTEKPVLHISLNPSVDDRLTDGQFAELAREYMQKMGYGDQPYIVYLHEDIDRRHVHIVSTCVTREAGIKVGLARIRMFRPFPKEEIVRIFKGRKAVGVIDRSIALGWNCGTVYQEVKAAISGHEDMPKMLSFIDGISTMDITREHIELAVGMTRDAGNGEPVKEVNWLSWE